MKNQSFYDKSNTYFIEYKNVEGLTTASPVTINGLNVGSIKKIDFHPRKQDVMVVNIQMPNDLTFSENSTAEIYSPGFIGGKSLKINLAYDNAPLIRDKDTIKSHAESSFMGMINDQLGPLQSKVESFVISTDSVMNNLNKVLDQDNQKNLKLSLQGLTETLANFNNASRKLDKLLENNDEKIDSVLNHVNISMGNLAVITDSLRQANLGAAVMDMKASLESVSVLLKGMERGEGNLGKLLNEDGLYDNLERATKELEELLRDFKLHPKRYVNVSVFGKKEKPYVENPTE